MDFRYLTSLDLRVYKPKLWVVISDYKIQTQYGVIIVQRGLITDLASTPQSLHGLPVFDPLGGSRHAGVMHDDLYARQGHAHLDDGSQIQLTREQCDGLLREGLIYSGMSDEAADAYYAAVRAFGQSYWDRTRDGSDWVTDDYWLRTGCEFA